MTFAASATFTDGAEYVPALIIFLYTLSIAFLENEEHPEVTFTIFSRVLFYLQDLFSQDCNRKNLLKLLAWIFFQLLAHIFLLLLLENR